MKLKIKVIFLSSLFAILCFSGIRAQTKPVNPNASPEAVELLNYIYSISGKQTLAGQHVAPLAGDTWLSIVHRKNGKYPALYGQDFGFSYPGYWDGINYRQRIVDDAIQRSRDGFIITLMWHAVLPTEDEPVTFKESVQGELSDEQWMELVTPGTEINERWKSQVDVIAWFLKQLRYADVPVLWRPYHEMNGSWFWWGKKEGEDGYKKLWRMMYERLVNFHGLDNLIWVYNTNEFKNGVDRHDVYYPGDDVVDIFATDVYSEAFNMENYEQLVELAGSKPIALGEVGTPPTMDVLEKQPRWTWFMRWDQRSWDEKYKYKEVINSEQVLSLDELPWVDLKDPKMHYPYLK